MENVSEAPKLYVTVVYLSPEARRRFNRKTAKQVRQQERAKVAKRGKYAKVLKVVKEV